MEADQFVVTSGYLRVLKIREDRIGSLEFSLSRLISVVYWYYAVGVIVILLIGSFGGKVVIVFPQNFFSKTVHHLNKFPSRIMCDAACLSNYRLFRRGYQESDQRSRNHGSKISTASVAFFSKTVDQC